MIQFHKTILQEFYQVTFRKKIYADIESLQTDLLDEWLEYYNGERTHQGKVCCGRTPMETLEECSTIGKEDIQPLAISAARALIFSLFIVVPIVFSLREKLVHYGYLHNLIYSLYVVDIS